MAESSPKGERQTGSERQVMVFGHNTNLKFGVFTFHIQTEDRGEPHALIDTTVYYHGRVLHRRTNNYFDLLPMDEDREQALRLRVDEQHRMVIDEIRSGALQLAVPPDTAAMRPAEKPPIAEAPAPVASAEPKKLVLRLTNAKSWLSGKHAKLQISVCDEDGTAASDAQIKVEFDGSEGGQSIQGQTDSQGEAVIEFELPRITSPDAAMVIWGESLRGKGYLRFALRAKPRVVTR